MWSNINMPGRRTPTAANIPSVDIWSQSNTRQQTPNYDVNVTNIFFLLLNFRFEIHTQEETIYN